MPLLLALAATAGFYHIGAKSMWYDELVSVAVARLDLAPLFHVVSTGEPQMSLYHFLLHWSIRLLGANETAVRALSAVAGVGAVLLMYLLGRRLLGARAALLGASLLALHAFFVLHMQEARAYTLLVLFTTASSLLFLRALEKPSAGRWAAYTLVSVLGVYTHLFAGWTTAAHACALLPATGRPASRLRGGLALAAVGGLSLPLFYWMRQTPAHVHAWIQTPDQLTLQTFVHDFSGFGGWPVALLFTGLSAAYLWFARPPLLPGVESRYWTKAFLLLWASIVIVGPLVASFVVRPMFVPRYVISALVPLLLLTAGGFEVVRPAWLRIGLTIVVLVTFVRACDRLYRGAPLEDWRGAMALLLDRARAGDAVVFRRSFNRFALDFYDRRRLAVSKGLQPVFPPDGWDSSVLHEGQYSDADTSLQTYQVLDQRVWTIERWYESDTTAELGWLPTSFRSRYCEAERHHPLRVRVTLHLRCDASRD